MHLHKDELLNDRKRILRNICQQEFVYTSKMSTGVAVNTYCYEYDENTHIFLSSRYTLNRARMWQINILIGDDVKPYVHGNGGSLFSTRNMALQKIKQLIEKRSLYNGN